MHVFLTGATGYVGTYVVRELLAQGHTVRALVRPGSEDRLEVRDERVAVASGDAAEPGSLAGAMDGCDAVIHLIAVIDERPSKGVTFERMIADATHNVVEEARAAGVPTFVHMSANGARPDGTGYERAKYRAEESVRAAGFRRWTIFRPSILFGEPAPGRPEFASRLADTLIRPFPVLPVFGDGQYRLQPVHVEQVARALVQALDREEAAGRTFCVGGTETVTFDEVLDRIALGMGLKPKPKLHQPLFLARILVDTVGRLGLIPISPAQFRMLVGGNTCDASDFHRVFDVEPIPFTPERLAYLKR